jgi:small basic protein
MELSGMGIGIIMGIYFHGSIRNTTPKYNKIAV